MMIGASRLSHIVTLFVINQGSSFVPESTLTCRIHTNLPKTLNLQLQPRFPTLKSVSKSNVASNRQGYKRRSIILKEATTTENHDSKDNIVGASVAVGAITATTGFLYGKFLNAGFQLFWKTLPNYLINTLGASRNFALYYITGICTFGAILIGILSTIFQNANFAVSDFVSAFSSTPAKKLPSTRIHLFPLLLMSLLTSSFGFSLGPEAPMVCAGGLIGASMGRYFSQKNNNCDETTSNNYQEILAYAGAAGALTAFMGIPLAGSIFALEMTRSNAALNKAGDQALSPTVIASLSALLLLCYGLNPGKVIGGNFDYGAVGILSGKVLMATATISGIAGAIVGTVFHKVVTKMKKLVWYTNYNFSFNKSSEEDSKTPKLWKKTILVKAIIGITVGLLSTYFPQTLFWGEGSLQSLVDGQKTPFEATHHGLSSIFTTNAIVDPSLPFTNTLAPLKVGLVKLLSIALACAGKFPGGIIFPLFAATAPLAHALSNFLITYTAFPMITPVAVMCLMAATQASATRTPMATALILTLTASPSTELSVFLPACLLSSYLGVFVSQRLSRNAYFVYNEKDD